MEVAEHLTIRAAVESDAPTLCRFIHGLFAHEGRADECVVSEAALGLYLFGPRPLAEAVVAEDADGVVGFAQYLTYFVAHLGQPGLFLDLLFVRPERRGRGYGRALLCRVAQIAIERGCGRLEWGVLAANASAIGFYERLGATVSGGMLSGRLDGDALRIVARQDVPT